MERPLGRSVPRKIMESRFNIMWTKLILLIVAASSLFAQTPPSVFIDSPTAGAALTGTVTITGWAIDNTVAPGTAISSVQVLVDGASMGNASYGVSRPDVCSVYPGRPGCPNVGYAFSLNTAALSFGSHTITVVATDTDFSPDSGSASVQVQVGTPPTVFIDTPTGGAVVGGIINVTGWALDEGAGGTAISGVQVSVDGAAAGNATYGVPRPDVCNAFPGRPNCPNVGYTFALNTGTYAAGTHTITVTATDSDGQPESGSANTTITVVAAPSVMIDSITPGATVTGVITVGGWALDNATSVGSAIGSVQIVVDGNAVGAATYGGARPDVCTVYRDGPAARTWGSLSRSIPANSHRELTR